MRTQKTAAGEKINIADNSAAVKHKRYDSDLALDKGRMLASLLLKVCSPAPPTPAADKLSPANHHSPSDQGIYMDSGSDVVVAKTTRIPATEGKLRGNGSDSAHSSTHSPTSDSSSLSASTSPEEASSLSLLYEMGGEEAVSLAYIDESKTVHKYIASRYTSTLYCTVYMVL